MKAINTIEEAVVGRTIKLSVVECLVIAELCNDLMGDINLDRKQQYVETKHLVNMRNLLMKLTGQDIISIEQAKEELFAPVEEEIVYDVEGNVVTSTVEAYAGNREGERRVGHIPLKKKLSDDDINDLVEQA